MHFFIFKKSCLKYAKTEEIQTTNTKWTQLSDKQRKIKNQKNVQQFHFFLIYEKMSLNINIQILCSYFSIKTKRE